MKPVPAVQQWTSLILFYFLTILLSFGLYLLPLPKGEMLQVPIVFVPTLVALALVALEQGRSGIRSLLKNAFDWKNHLKDILLALGLAFTMRLIIALVALALGWISEIQVRDWNPVQFALFAAAVYIFALLEEIGWRGFALPKLLHRYSALLSGLIIGLLWGTVHLVLHLPGMTLAGQSPVITIAQLIGLSLLITWVFTISKGSIVAAAVLHGGQNFFVTFNDGLDLAQQAILMAFVYCGLAVLVTLLSGPHFQRAPKAEDQLAAL